MISQAARDLAVGDTQALNALFVETDSPPPVICWEPEAGELPNERLRFLLEFWRSAPRDGDLPSIDSLDPLALKPALGLLMILEPVDGGADFRYRLYGSEIAARAGLDLTGKLVTNVRSAKMAAFFIATYAAVLLRRRPLYTRHTTNPAIQITQWDRLLLPFAGRDGAVERLLVGNLPGDRTL